MNAIINIRCHKCREIFSVGDGGAMLQGICYRFALPLFDTFCTILVVHLSVSKSDVSTVNRLSPMDSTVQRCEQLSFHVSWITDAL
jgi:hypothetical protein